MSAYIVSPAAREDLVTIWSYYAIDMGDVDLADRIQAELVQRSEASANAWLGSFP